jgi:flagellar protein FliS
VNATATAQSAYKQSSILTAPPGQLVVMLYDGARRFLHQGALAMEEGAIATANERLQRAEAILDELLATLDMSAGDVAIQLQSLYLFAKRALAEARPAQDAEKVRRVSRLLGELRESWAQIAST